MTETFARPQAPWALRLVPPFPAVAHRVLGLVGQEDIPIRDLGKVVQMDPSFSAELLRFANSALFGARREVRSLPQAIAMVGIDRLRAIATFIAMNRMVSPALRIEALRKVWVHSLVTALIAEEASRVSNVARDSAYTAGLLHAGSIQRFRFRSTPNGARPLRDRPLHRGRIPGSGLGLSR